MSSDDYSTALQGSIGGDVATTRELTAGVAMIHSMGNPLCHARNAWFRNGSPLECQYSEREPHPSRMARVNRNSSRYFGATRLPLARRVRLCMEFGLTLAVGYSALAAALFVIQGRALSLNGLRFLALLCGSYVAVGVLGGALAGVVLPWTRFRAVAALLGVAVFYPLAVLLLLLSGEVTLSSGIDLWLDAGLGALALGVGISQIVWKMEWGGGEFSQYACCMDSLVNSVPNASGARCQCAVRMTKVRDRGRVARPGGSSPPALHNTPVRGEL